VSTTQLPKGLPGIRRAASIQIELSLYSFSTTFLENRCPSGASVQK
jgi:hypothetical protein